MGDGDDDGDDGDGDDGDDDDDGGVWVIRLKWRVCEETGV